VRPSSRALILDAAIRVVERDGITGLTLESAAVEAGVTKGGLMYHFRTRDALLLAIQRHMSEAWEAALLAELAVPVDEATPGDLVAAYATVAARLGARTADLAFMVESATHPALARVWMEFTRRWSPVPGSADPVEVDRFLARLAADGMWFFEVTRGEKIPAEVKRAVLERLIGLAGKD
jgi:AcrR family transcriptional regulator